MSLPQRIPHGTFRTATEVRQIFNGRKAYPATIHQVCQFGYAEFETIFTMAE